MDKLLTTEQIGNSLAFNSHKLASQVFDLVQKQLSECTGRQTRLDAKATSLLTAIGLSFTVATTFGAQIVLGKAETMVQSGWRWHFALAMSALCFVVGVSAGFLALWALRVRDNYAMIDEGQLFDRELLADKNNDSEDDALREYQKTMAMHLWLIVQNHVALHREKSLLIKYGQVCFCAFLVLLPFLIVAFALCLRT